MSYIDENLMDGEVVVYRTRLHWIVFAWPFFWVALFAVMLGMGDPTAPLAWITIICALITGIPALINYLTSEFGLTNKRVIIKVGWLKRYSFETLLNKIEGIQVSQSIPGRMLDYGTIIITGTGGSREPFVKISSPLEFRRQVQQQIASKA